MEIARILKISETEAEALVQTWQQNQEDIRDKLNEQAKEVAKAKLEKRKAMVPIWRCAVCGRADLPYIACFVSPYIVRYQEVDI